MRVRREVDIKMYVRATCSCVGLNMELEQADIGIVDVEPSRSATVELFMTTVSALRTSALK